MKENPPLYASFILHPTSFHPSLFTLHSSALSFSCGPMNEYTIPLILLFAASALTSFVSTGIVKVAAERIGAVDRPDTDRKTHTGETPRIGGLAIIFGFGVPLLLLAG